MYHISYKDLTNAHVYFYHHFISTVFLQHYSGLKQPWSTKYIPDVKFSLVSSAYYITELLHHYICIVISVQGNDQDKMSITVLFHSYTEVKMWLWDTFSCYWLNMPQKICLQTTSINCPHFPHWKGNMADQQR